MFNGKRPTNIIHSRDTGSNGFVSVIQIIYVGSFSPFLTAPCLVRFLRSLCEIVGRLKNRNEANRGRYDASTE